MGWRVEYVNSSVNEYKDIGEKEKHSDKICANDIISNLYMCSTKSSIKTGQAPVKSRKPIQQYLQKAALQKKIKTHTKYQIHVLAKIS